MSSQQLCPSKILIKYQRQSQLEMSAMDNRKVRPLIAELKSQTLILLRGSLKLLNLHVSGNKEDLIYRLLDYHYCDRLGQLNENQMRLLLMSAGYNYLGNKAMLISALTDIPARRRDLIFPDIYSGTNGRVTSWDPILGYSLTPIDNEKNIRRVDTPLMTLANQPIYSVDTGMSSTIVPTRPSDNRRPSETFIPNQNQVSANESRNLGNMSANMTLNKGIPLFGSSTTIEERGKPQVELIEEPITQIATETLFIQVKMDINDLNEMTKSQLSDMPQLIHRLADGIKSMLYHNNQKTNGNVKVGLLMDPSSISLNKG
jgi:hypothetical protein